MAGFDTHVHSTASDGGLAPATLVAMARDRGLLGLALTDHDTVDGLAEAIGAGEELDYPVIPGIELSAERQERDVHILGYWIDPQRLLAQNRLQQLQTARAERIREIARRLGRLGMPLDATAILEQAGDSPGRPHIAQAMVAAGYVENRHEAFQRWLSRGTPGYVPRAKLDPFEAVALIQSAGGVAAVAHPGCGVPDALLLALLRRGLGGIEVYHPEHDPMMEKHYARLARLHRVAALGGSDFHLPGFHELGRYVTTVGQLGKLAAFRRD